MWCLYILRCADDSLYTGITNDLDARVSRHESGSGAKYTRGRRPVKLVYSEPCPGRSEAARREWQVKQLSRQGKLKLIESGASS